MSDGRLDRWTGVRDSKSIGGGVKDVVLGEVELAGQDLTVRMSCGNSCQDGAGFRAELGWLHIKALSRGVDRWPSE